ncbi:MAG TPA: hypothetical protein VGK30_20835 [Candidatus Binatia bacterium]
MRVDTRNIHEGFSATAVTVVRTVASLVVGDRMSVRSGVGSPDKQNAAVFAAVTNCARRNRARARLLEPMFRISSSVTT